jgi:hypothetical protein
MIKRLSLGELEVGMIVDVYSFGGIKFEMENGVVHRVGGASTVITSDTHSLAITPSDDQTFGYVFRFTGKRQEVANAT